MNHYTLYKKPENVLKEYVIPLLAQFAILVIVLIPQRFFKESGDFIMEQVMLGDELTKPRSGRAAYVFIGMAASFICGFIASKMAKKGKLFAPFFVAVAGGTFLWQSIGEDAWHFGVDNGEFITYFSRLESVQVLPIVVPFLALTAYGIVNHSFDWGVLNLILSFICNWIGHFVSLGTAPLMSSFVDEGTWIMASSMTVGIILTLLGVYMGIFASKDTKARLTSSMITYIGIGVISFAFIDG